MVPSIGSTLCLRAADHQRSINSKLGPFTRVNRALAQMVVEALMHDRTEPLRRAEPGGSTCRSDTHERDR